MSNGGSILAGLTVVVSSHGSPGCTTVALNLATALGAGTSTLLVDADVVKPSVVAHIDGDPTRCLISSRSWRQHTSQVGKDRTAKGPGAIRLL